MTNPKILNLKETKIIGYEIKTKNIEGENNKEIPQFWDKLMKEGKLEMIPDTINPNTTYGICIDNGKEDSEFSYIVGMEVSSFENLFDDMVSITLPKSKYAVFNVDVKDGISENIGKTYNYIHKEWLPNSEYEYGDNPDFELYDERFIRKDNPNMDIYYPIKKK